MRKKIGFTIILLLTIIALSDCIDIFWQTNGGNENFIDNSYLYTNSDNLENDKSKAIIYCGFDSYEEFTNLGGHIYKYEKNPIEKYDFVSGGFKGGALYVNGDHYYDNTTYDICAIPLSNLTSECGTIDFMFKPDNWNSSDTCNIHYFISAIDGINKDKHQNTLDSNTVFLELCYKGAGHYFGHNLLRIPASGHYFWGLFYVTAAYPHHYSFTNNQWLHIRFSWSMEKKLLGKYSFLFYVNGNILTKITNDIDGIYNLKKYLVVGSAGTHVFDTTGTLGNMYQNACGYFDELYVYTNILDY